MPHSPPVVLFADAHPGRHRALRSGLRRRGAVVLHAGSAAEILAALSRWPADLVVLDGDLEDLGPDVAAALVRRQAPAALLVVESASWTPERKHECVSRLGVRWCPAKPADPAELDQEISGLLGRRLRPAGPGPGASPRVLCVDDDFRYLDALRRVLARGGYRPSTFVAPERALAAAPGLDPDLAILDVRMPGLDGLELARRLWTRCPKRPPVVLLTACSRDEDMVDAYRNGVSYYITKPCTSKTVLNIVDYLVGNLDPLEREALEAEL